MNRVFLVRAACVTAIAGALVGIGGGIASAATPAHPVGSSEGIHLTDVTADSFVLTSVSGDNEGVPTVGSVLTDDNSYQDFEVTFRAFKSTTVTADYTVQDASGAQIGTAVVKLSDDAVDVPSASGTFTATNGQQLPMQVVSDNPNVLSDFEIDVTA